MWQSEASLKNQIKGNIFLNIWARAFIRISKSISTLVRSVTVTTRRPLFRNYYVCPKGCDIAYLNIGKTGCSSIRKALLECDIPGVEVDDNQEIHRYTDSLIKYKLKGKDRERFIFAFVRNPFDRIVSLYKNKFRSLRNLDVEGFMYTDYLNGIFHPQMSFDEFVETMVKIPDRLADRHFKSQYCMIYEVPDLPVGFVGKFENLSSDFEQLRKRFPALGELPHFNKSSAGSDYRAFYNHHTARLVAERYRRDIEEFHYEAERDDLFDYLDSRSSEGAGETDRPASAR